MDDSYFAGFFDADGCVSIARGSGTSYFLLNCSVSNTNFEVLVAFVERFGGKVAWAPSAASRSPNAKPIAVWQADAAKGEAFLRVVAPYLIVKRERVQTALEFRDLFKGENILPRGKDVHRFPEKRQRILACREQAYDRMRVLNRRGA